MSYENSENYITETVKETRTKPIPKCSFQLKNTGKDGLVLQVHHTLPEAGGKVRSYRFTYTSFDITGEKVAVSDPLGNAFVVDLSSHKFWMLPELPPCNLMTFAHYTPRRNDVLIGTLSGPIYFINTDTGENTGELVGHRKSPVNVSFAEEGPYCLSNCTSSAIIWDLRTNSVLHQLTLRSSIHIKQVRFMPVTNNILGLFEDNSVHVWKLENLECTKQIFPDEWGGPNIKAIALTRNGRGMVVGGLSATLAVFLLDNWTLQKLIALPDNVKGVKQLQFVPQLFDGGSNKILALLTTSCSVLFVDTETSILLRVVQQLEGCVSRLESSLSGKYVMLVQDSGEVNIYNSSQLVTGGRQTSLVSEARPRHSHSQSSVRSRSVKEIKTLIDPTRLRSILKEFGEYPEVHRSLIWQILLNLPENQSAFVALINKGVHPAFSTLDKDFPLRDKSISSSVKRLLSCLAYWSPIFVQVKYLPIFVLPFVKLNRHDQYSTFEIVASIIVNWCQGWFEYVPYPPVNILDKVKTLLATHDKQLFTHFNNCHVTPDIYIWSLLETAFYEVLGWSEWQLLWDHILSNHPAFFLFAVVAFNITCRSLLLTLDNVEDIEFFFHTEAVINMKQFITKTYQIWTDTKSDVHPKHSMKTFKPLVKGNMYQMFTDYPKDLLDQQLNKLKTFYDEQTFLESQHKDVEKLKLDLDFNKKQAEDAYQRQSKLRELDEKYKTALKREEENLESQRKNVSAARRELRETEVVFRSQSVEKTLQDKADKYAQLERLVEKIENKKCGSEYQSTGSWTSSYQSTNPTALRLQHASVVYHLSKLRKLRRSTNTDCSQLNLCISKFEKLLERIESALEREQTSKQQRPCHTEQLMSLDEETHALEDEAQNLLKKLSKINSGAVSFSKTHCSRCSRHEPANSKGGQYSCYCCGDSKSTKL